jgi:ketosteroid isomerase-like protein
MRCLKTVCQQRATERHASSGWRGPLNGAPYKKAAVGRLVVEPNIGAVVASATGCGPVVAAQSGQRASTPKSKVEVSDLALPSADRYGLDQPNLEELVMTDSVTPEFLDAFADAWNRHDADAIVSMMTKDCVMCLPAGSTKEGARFEGHDAIKGAARAVFARMPDVKWLNVRHFIAGDRGVSEWVLVANGPDGQKIETNGCDVFRFRDGLIAFKDTFRKSIV